MTPKLSDWYSWPSFFRISAKKRQRIASSLWRGISSNFLALLRCTCHWLKTFQLSFCTLRGVLVLVFVSRVGKFLFWKGQEIEKFGISQWPNSAIVNYKQRQQYRCYAWLTLCFNLCWLASFYYRLYFLGLYWLRQTVLNFLNWTVCLFLWENPIWNYPNKSLIGQF